MKWEALLVLFKLGLDKKARFARVCAARGWGPAYQATCVDLNLQSHPLERPSEILLLILEPPIRLLIED